MGNTEDMSQYLRPHRTLLDFDGPVIFMAIWNESFRMIVLAGEDEDTGDCTWLAMSPDMTVVRGVMDGTLPYIDAWRCGPFFRIQTDEDMRVLDSSQIEAIDADFLPDPSITLPQAAEALKGYQV